VVLQAFGHAEIDHAFIRHGGDYECGDGSGRESRSAKLLGERRRSLVEQIASS
jgi:hypothetical protein